MQLNKKDALLVKNVLSSFKDDGLLSSEKFDELNKNINVLDFDYKKLSKWCFIFSIFCFIISMFNINFLYLNLKVVRIIISLVLSSIFYFLGFKKTNKKLLNEILIFSGSLSTGWFFIEIMSIFKDSSSLILFFSACFYFLLAYYKNSSLILFFSIITFGNWFGAELGYLGYGSYFIAFSKPLIFVFFGLLLICLSYIFNKYKKELTDLTLFMGLFYLFISLWMLSIFGFEIKFNQDITLFWSILFGIVAFISFYFGLKYDNSILRKYGIIFFLINLYTKFFEYFWDITAKFLFFAILGFSLFLIGFKAEKIYINIENIINKNIK